MQIQITKITILMLSILVNTIRLDNTQAHASKSQK